MQARRISSSINTKCVAEKKDEQETICLRPQMLHLLHRQHQNHLHLSTSQNLF
jgi:hypothetical protein